MPTSNGKRHAQAVSRIPHLVTPECFHRLCSLIARALLLVADRCSAEFYPGDISSASPIPTGHIPRPTLSPAFQSFDKRLNAVNGCGQAAIALVHWRRFGSSIMADELQTSINYTLQHLHANHVDQLLLGAPIRSYWTGYSSAIYIASGEPIHNALSALLGSSIMQGTQKQTHECPIHAPSGPTDLAILSRPRYRTLEIPSMSGDADNR
ncbi:uncharacterized protein BO96DRAFT_328316 [Aspergillus niger CBS 101883]|uniref:Uncharacterized protein n=2 Tax=Aspergillus niger TaxID=5061 RepID=A2QFH5_ASPNC|nr:uncharacterized protein BO96DRAFT_328316 [Aspergillus niger CBS 101883]XP_059605738.1 hypothetical protein An02g14570 [Aspergillus niger]PYH60568.1 hypothetical protein BO96DRAFT_328316 [Aspergillus niger CBS 101883]CAK48886.1 hypothetical protein An02g14570 [Aspergillus niger]